jgi:hypothetical protein
MAVTVDEAKVWLREDSDDEAVLKEIQDMIDAAEIYITNGSGYNFLTPNKLADLAVKVLVTHWYEFRGSVLIGSISKEIEFSLKSILAQLSYCYEEGE